MFISFLSIQVRTLHPTWILEFTSTLAGFSMADITPHEGHTLLRGQTRASACLSSEPSLDAHITSSIQWLPRIYL